MLYVLSMFWVWDLLALVLGVCAGIVGWSRMPRKGWLAGWLRPALVLFGIGLLLAGFNLLPGRWGLGLAVALQMFVFYLVGCLVGSFWMTWRARQFAMSAAPLAFEIADPQVAPPPAPAVVNETLAGTVAARADGGSAGNGRNSTPDETPSVPETTPILARAPIDEMPSGQINGSSVIEPPAKDDGQGVNEETAAAEASEAAGFAHVNEEPSDVGGAAPGTDISADPPTPVATPGEAGRPQGLPAPRDGKADDLKLIKGIGPKNERACNALGVWHFAQIADWTPDEAKWVGGHIAFPGRIEREQWIPQARLLSAGMDTAHSAAVKSGEIVIDDSADAPLSEAEAETLAQSLPAMSAPVENEGHHDGRRPFGLSAAKGGKPDNLKLIRGIGPQNEGRLHGLGIWHFEQIAAWSADNARWVGSFLAFKGRIEREQWIAQAKELAAGRETEFARRAAAGKVATSRDDGNAGQGNVAQVLPDGGKRETP